MRPVRLVDGDDPLDPAELRELASRLEIYAFHDAKMAVDLGNSATALWKFADLLEQLQRHSEALERVIGASD
jgi:hypothetical protein